MKKAKIVYIAPTRSSFVKTDIKFLQHNFGVKHHFLDWKNKRLLPFTILKQLIWLIKEGRNCKAFLISFGGFWSILPVLFGKFFKIPVFIILNGTDCAALPSVKYGSLRKPLTKLACFFSYKLAYQLLPVSQSLVKVVNTYYPYDQNQGYKHFFSNIKTPYTVIPNGLDVTYWKKNEKIKKEPKSFITVFNQPQFILKGGDIIMQLASRLPNCTFYICGCLPPSTLIPTNVQFLGRLEPDALKDRYSATQFHLQLSVFEGFGMSLCEAMLCECIPIGSSVNEIPKIIGNTGLIAETCDISQVLKTVYMGLQILDKEKTGQLARSRILNNYTIENRIKLLTYQINSAKY